MKWQQIALLLMGIILVGGTVTYVDLFSGLFQLTGVSYTNSGDITCGEECESYINITTTYWRICFAGYEDTKYEDELLFKKRSRSNSITIKTPTVLPILISKPEIPCHHNHMFFGVGLHLLKSLFRCLVVHLHEL